MRVADWIILSVAIGLAACGSEESERAASSRGGTTQAASSNGSMTAETVAEAARGRVKCPAQIRSTPRDKNAPVDDIVGVRPGMTYDEAANVVLCTNDLIVVASDAARRFRIETYGQPLRQGFNARFAEPKVQKSSKQIMAELQDSAMARSSNRAIRDVKPGQSKWYVGTMGAPGAERVISAAREEWFDEDANPALASVEQALVAKYGAPTRIQSSPGRLSLTWAYDPFGRPITETSPLFQRCHGTADPDASTNFSPDCGIVVAATISGRRTNPDLAEYMQVGVLDQAGGYEAITSTEQQLQVMEMQRRAEQTKSAAKNATAPTL